MAVLDFYGMFDYAEGDGETYEYTSAEFSELIAGVTGNGVSANTLSSFSTTASGLNLTVQPGVCFINGRYGANHSAKALSTTSTTSSTKRYDRLVIELSSANRTLELKIIKGTAVSGTPAVPALTQNDVTWQMPLYLILVNGSALTLTDERPMTYSVAQIQAELQNRSLLGHGHTLSEISGITINSTASNIQMNGTQSAGSGTSVARANHVHPTDTSRAAASHTHTLSDISGISLNTTASNIQMNGTQSAGSGTAVAKANHVHPTDTSRAAASHNHDSRYYTETEVDTKISNILGSSECLTDASTDLNNLKTGGVYNIWVSGASPKHSPSAGGGLHILFVLAYGNYGVQVCFCCGANTGTTEAYVRTFYSGGTFQAWKEMTN